jgi:hypothetical protein
MSIIHNADLPDAGSARGIDEKDESIEDGAAQVALELSDEPICKNYVAEELPNSLPRDVENDNAAVEQDFDVKSKSLQSRFEYIVPGCILYAKYLCMSNYKFQSSSLLRCLRHPLKAPN